ncbi:MAG: hypothetical protein JWL72_1190 [Ilumatobacteraceae bacterium]|nr:hypothetical protein [Ilumatobacteraceae bacterium]
MKNSDIKVTGRQRQEWDAAALAQVVLALARQRLEAKRAAERAQPSEPAA